MAGNRRAGTTKLFARSILSCALLSVTMVAAAQTNQQSADLGSVPSGPATNEVLHLTLRDAINRAVRYNLGQIESGENARIARGQRLRALSALLPQISAGAAEDVEQFSKATLGIKIPQIPAVIGPFSFSTAEVSASQTLFSLESIQRLQSARSAEQAAQLTYRDTLDVITLIVGNAYLQVIQASSRVTAEEAQVKNAQVLYEQAVEQLQAGTTLVLRATILTSRSSTFRVPSACHWARPSIWLINCRMPTSIRRAYKMP